MLDRPRIAPLGWAVLCLGLFTLLAVLVAVEWAALVDLDESGKDAPAWIADRQGVEAVLEVVEIGFNTIAMTIYTALLAIGLFVKNHRRAAILTVAVMAVTALATTVLKTYFARTRPEWQSPSSLLENNAFPSGHASSVAALAGLVMVLVAMLVRRSNMRRLAYVVAGLVVVLVAADRVLLGRHFPSDVVAGVLLGAFVVLLGVALYNPLPRSIAASAEPLPEAIPSARQLAVVLNPIKVEDVGQFRAVVSTMATEAGWSEPTWHYTTIEDPGTGMAEAASVAGADLVLVCGGDGTVREVCAELAGTGIPVGIVPAGTGNLLARNLGIPLYIRAAIDVALNGQDRAIDMVSVGGDHLEDTHFMVMAGMGFDAAIMEGVNEDIKKRIGWFAYVISALKSLMFPAVRLEISIDGDAVHQAPRPDRRGRQRRHAAGRHAAAARCVDRRRPGGRGDPPPPALPVLALRGLPRADQAGPRRRHDQPDDRPLGGDPGRDRHPAPARRRLDRHGPRAADGVHPRPAAGPRPSLTVPLGNAMFGVLYPAPARGLTAA